MAINGNGVWKWIATLLLGLIGGLLPMLYVNAQKPSREEVERIILQEMRIVNERHEGLKALIARTELAVDRARAELLAEIRKGER